MNISRLNEKQVDREELRDASNAIDTVRVDGLYAHRGIQTGGGVVESEKRSCVLG